MLTRWSNVRKWTQCLTILANVKHEVHDGHRNSIHRGRPLHIAVHRAAYACALVLVKNCHHCIPSFRTQRVSLCLRRVLIGLCSLCLLAFQSPLAGSLVLRTLGVHLILDSASTLFLSLGLVDLVALVSRSIKVSSEYQETRMTR